MESPRIWSSIRVLKRRDQDWWLLPQTVAGRRWRGNTNSKFVSVFVLLLLLFFSFWLCLFLREWVVLWPVSKSWFSWRGKLSWARGSIPNKSFVAAPIRVLIPFFGEDRMYIYIYTMSPWAVVLLIRPKHLFYRLKRLFPRVSTYIGITKYNTC